MVQMQQPMMNMQPIQGQMQQPNQPMPQMQQPMPQMQQPMVQQQVQMAPQNQVVYPPQQGGMPPPNFTAVVGGFQPATFPGQGGMIVVDTSGGAMAAEGLGPVASGGRRTRASYQGVGGMQGAPVMPSIPSAMPSAMPTGGFQNITINKME